VRNACDALASVGCQLVFYGIAFHGFTIGVSVRRDDGGAWGTW
jgi:hypothetical protein